MQRKDPAPQRRHRLGGHRRLDGGDFYPHEAIAAFAWPMLLQAGGLAQFTGGGLALTTRGRAALTRPLHLTISQLWQRWLNNSLLDELSRVEEIKGQRAANVLTAAKPRRKLVGQALAGLTSGEWTSIDGLFTDMRAAGLDPVVHRSERALWKLYLEDPHTAASAACPGRRPPQPGARGRPRPAPSVGPSLSE